MDELDSILSVLKAQSQASQDAVLTTVVHVRGSAYRRPGARMLILPDGRRTGSISGGCLEGDVCRKAWWTTEGGKAAVRVYDTSSDEDVVREFGLGCNGIIHVLFERVADPAVREMLSFLAETRAARRIAAVATVIATGTTADSFAVGDRLLFGGDGIRGGPLAGSALEPEVLPRLRDVWAGEKSFLLHLDSADVFLEHIAPPPKLVVFGAGNDAQPLVRFATELGWHVTVLDGRPQYATRQRFPEANQVVVLSWDDPLWEVEIFRDTAVVIMTHNYPRDLALLPHILACRPHYLGLLGPKSRTDKLLSEVGLPLRGVGLFSPVGLDLGSDAPAAIALAIIAEIQAVFCGRSGGMLRDRDAPIHEPAMEDGVAEAIEIRREMAICDLA